MDKFKITKEHLLLIKNFNVDWVDGESGAPGVDSKRPYGNSDHLQDIATILKWKIKDGELSETQETKAQKLHEEMETVLQICFSTLTFKEGTYKLKEKYSNEWVKVK
jgi:hypothetical protein